MRDSSDDWVETGRPREWRPGGLAPSSPRSRLPDQSEPTGTSAPGPRPVVSAPSLTTAGCEPVIRRGPQGRKGETTRPGPEPGVASCFRPGRTHFREDDIIMITTRWRHRFAAFALAVSLPVGSGLLAANTAFLANTADGGLPLHIDPYNPQTTPPATLSLRLDPNDVPRAVDKAGIVLRDNNACNALITGVSVADLPKRKSAGTDALSVLTAIQYKTVVDDQGNFVVKERPPLKPVTAAEVVRSDNPTQKGQGAMKNGRMDFYLPVFSGINDTFIFDFILTVSDRIDRTVSDETLRQLIVLHEFAHLTNANDHPEGDPDREFNKKILNICFNYTIGPRSIGGGGGGGGGGEYQEP